MLQAYKPEFYWFEVLECARRLMLASVIGIVNPGTAASAILGILVCFMFCHVFEKRPFKENDDNELSVVLAWSLTLFFLSAICIKADLAEDSGEEQRLFGIALTVILATGPALIVLQTAKAVLEHFVSKTKKNRTDDMDESEHEEKVNTLKTRRRQAPIGLYKTMNKTRGSISVYQNDEDDDHDLEGGFSNARLPPKRLVESRSGEVSLEDLPESVAKMWDIELNKDPKKAQRLQDMRANMSKGGDRRPSTQFKRKDAGTKPKRRKSAVKKAQEAEQKMRSRAGDSTEIGFDALIGANSFDFADATPIVRRQSFTEAGLDQISLPNMEKVSLRQRLSVRNSASRNKTTEPDDCTGDFETSLALHTVSSPRRAVDDPDFEDSMTRTDGVVLKGNSRDPDGTESAEQLKSFATNSDMRIVLGMKKKSLWERISVPKETFKDNVSDAELANDFSLTSGQETKIEGDALSWEATAPLPGTTQTLRNRGATLDSSESIPGFISHNDNDDDEDPVYESGTVPDFLASIKFGVFWRDFEKRGYKTFSAFVDSSRISDDDLKSMGMGKAKTQLLRRLLKNGAAQSYLKAIVVILGASFTDAEVKVKFQAVLQLHAADGLNPSLFEELMNALLSEKAYEFDLPSSNDLLWAFEVVDVDRSGFLDEDEVAVIYKVARSGQLKGKSIADQKENFKELLVAMGLPMRPEPVTSISLVSSEEDQLQGAQKQDLHDFLVKYKLDKYETALVTQGLSTMSSLDDKALATDEALKACGMSALEMRKLRIFIAKFKLDNPAAFVVASIGMAFGDKDEDLPSKSLSVGGSVTLNESNGELPEGTKGKVVQLHHNDGDAECIFETFIGPMRVTCKMTLLTRVEQPGLAFERQFREKFAETLKTKGLDGLTLEAFKELAKDLLQNYEGVADVDLPQDKELDVAFSVAVPSKSNLLNEDKFLALMQVIAQYDTSNIKKLSVFSKKKVHFKKFYETILAANALRAQQGAARKLVKWRRRGSTRKANNELDEMRSYLEQCKLESVVETLTAHGIKNLAALHDPEQASDEALMACLNKLEFRRLRLFMARNSAVPASPTPEAHASSSPGGSKSPALSPSPKPRRSVAAGLFGVVPQGSEL